MSLLVHLAQPLGASDTLLMPVVYEAIATCNCAVDKHVLL